MLLSITNLYVTYSILYYVIYYSIITTTNAYYYYIITIYIHPMYIYHIYMDSHIYIYYLY